MSELRVLCLGDVVGRPGVKAIKRYLPGWRRELNADLVVANVENACDGSGLTVAQATQLREAGCDVMTNGDHCYRRAEVKRCLQEPTCLRPANFMTGSPGRGWCVVEVGGRRIGVINVLGQVFMRSCDNPFDAIDRCLDAIEEDGGAEAVLLDLHAEATSEKAAIGHYVDGRICAIFGTHTHVPTADEGLLPKGTGFISDIGMCGPHRSVIGRSITPVVEAMATGEYQPFNVAKGDTRLNGVVITIAADGGCGGIERVRLCCDEREAATS